MMIHSRDNLMRSSNRSPGSCAEDWGCSAVGVFGSVSHLRLMFHGSVLVLLLPSHHLMMMVMARRRPQLQPPRLIQPSSRKPELFCFPASNQTSL